MAGSIVQDAEEFIIEHERERRLLEDAPPPPRANRTNASGGAGNGDGDGDGDEEGVQDLSDVRVDILVTFGVICRKLVRGSSREGRVLVQRLHGCAWFHVCGKEVGGVG